MTQSNFDQEFRDKIKDFDSELLINIQLNCTKKSKNALVPEIKKNVC